MSRVILNKKYMLYSLAELKKKYGKKVYDIDPGINSSMINTIWRNDRNFHPIVTVRREFERDVICEVCEGEGKKIKSDLFYIKENGFLFASWMIKELNSNRLKKKSKK